MNKQNDFQNNDDLDLKLQSIDNENNYQDDFDDEKKPSNHKGRKIVIKILAGFFILLFLLIIGGVATVLIMKNRGEETLHNYNDVTISTIDEAETNDEGKTVSYNGKKYKLNEDIITFAFLGIDKDKLDDVSGNSGGAGQADTIILLVLDTKNGVAKMISVPRDTMAEVDAYSPDGKFVRNEKMQLCLAYSFGDGKKTSCQNTITAVSRLLYGIPINSYAALDLTGIGVINDAIGGVTVNAIETIGPFKNGVTYNLKGENAMKYIRDRTHDQNGAYNRLQRQMQYINAFTKQAVSETISNFGTVKDLYETATPYVYTNVTLAQTTYLASSLLSKGITDFSQTMSIPGQSQMDENNTYVQYIVDEKALYEMILSVYYNEIN